MSKSMDEAISPENYGSWRIHGGEHCGVRIDGPNGRSVLHIIQRDAHPTLGQGITQAESEAIATRIVGLWNAALAAGGTPRDGKILEDARSALRYCVDHFDADFPGLMNRLDVALRPSCCEKGQSERVSVCRECAEASFGYSEAMSNDGR